MREDTLTDGTHNATNLAEYKAHRLYRTFLVVAKYNLRLLSPPLPQDLRHYDGGPEHCFERLTWMFDGHLATLEVYPDVDAAKRRAEHVETVGKRSPDLLQYVYRKGGLVLRLPAQLAPVTAEKWHKLLDGLPSRGMKSSKIREFTRSR